MIEKYEVAVVSKDGTYELEPAGRDTTPGNFEAMVCERLLNIKAHNSMVVALVLVELVPVVTVVV